jgi:rfaE bifunctional protein kinase chain/domain
MRVLVIGDVMIDAYLFGKVDRISPEAPVPVVSVSKKENRLGGAANVALNIKALGATPILCCIVGNDFNAQLVRNLLIENQLSDQGIVVDSDRPTTVKTRIIGTQQQMLRIDEETTESASEKITDQLLTTIDSILNNEKIDVIIFEDYDKGVITPHLIREVVSKATSMGIPTTVDPKKRNFLSFENVTLFKPNLKEIKEGLHISINPESESDLKNAFAALQERLHCTYALITLSEHGMFISGMGKDAVIPAHVRNIADVSGAGDTVISVASLCMACDTDVVFATQMANLAGGLVCEKVGVVPINGSLLKTEALRLFK